ncbi:hypothetical protein CEXT_73511, partial [Caerostris extrusa]
ISQLSGSTIDWQLLNTQWDRVLFLMARDQMLEVIGDGARFESHA